MTLMMSKLHAALCAAGVTEDKAREAAIEATEFRRPDLLEVKLTLRLCTWIATFNSMMLVIIVLKLYLRLRAAAAFARAERDRGSSRLA